jgi:hypothetical protein
VKELKSNSANSAVKLSVLGGKVAFEGRNLSEGGGKAVMNGILLPAGNVNKKNSTGVAKFEIIS